MRSRRDSIRRLLRPLKIRLQIDVAIGRRRDHVVAFAHIETKRRELTRFVVALTDKRVRVFLLIAPPDLVATIGGGEIPTRERALDNQS